MIIVYMFRALYAHHQEFELPTVVKFDLNFIHYIILFPFITFNT